MIHDVPGMNHRGITAGGRDYGVRRGTRGHTSNSRSGKYPSALLGGAESPCTPRLQRRLVAPGIFAASCRRELHGGSRSKKTVSPPANEKRGFELRNRAPANLRRGWQPHRPEHRKPGADAGPRPCLAFSRFSRRRPPSPFSRLFSPASCPPPYHHDHRKISLENPRIQSFTP